MAHAQRWVQGVTASHFFTLRRAGKVPAKQGFRLKPEEALDISADLLCTMLRKEKISETKPWWGQHCFGIMHLRIYQSLIRCVQCSTLNIWGREKKLLERHCFGIAEQRISEYISH
jgi:hypothetical protein